ncbi:PREDICTED: ubiquitin carboxyl-terminal hydrolase 12-like [Erythranthe guttata]|uniref:ubiquitin carboxyl-terminal hydrolase 12-like n=1 Tax=Erythranthe guttata TaxID=4155 RepID=UPI00064DE55D|nr:PREDICTED: ubiquitin carboxyl-terminal hydrolase 12-like [Erythranthe guttata]|eukprot:XP_012833004.1 PREDICTED: ubiquitin carboxyl-terminal hydrolase 12-like [Erythranthe guttata]
MAVNPAIDEITNMETREAPPAHLLIKIESFSLLGTCGIDKYETREFVAGDYKWKLIIYFNGKDCEYVSVNLAMADTSSDLPANWEVNVVFSFFLYNQISGNYLSSPDPSNGYLVNDNCVFGAEVFVVKKDAIIECVSLNNINIHYKHDLKISDFSKLNERLFSEQFIAGGQKWKIILDPKGSGMGTGSHVSIFLSYLGLERVQLLVIGFQLSAMVMDGLHALSLQLLMIQTKDS